MIGLNILNFFYLIATGISATVSSDISQQIAEENY
jgi:hypothetical protein